MISTVSRLDYCQFLIGTQINYPCAYMADHVPKINHDAVRCKSQEAAIWRRVDGYLVCQNGGDKEIERLDKVYYCPLQDNRQVDDSDGQRDYERVDQLTWSEDELTHGNMLEPPIKMAFA